MRKYKSINKHIDQEDNDDNSIESGLDSLSHDTKTSTSTSSAKRSKRGTYKRVILVPIKEIEGSRLKSENTPPPSDSWTWRKYGQKPIKGSPYPRGYYKCSCSKGCPARKQVERSRSDPTMLVVTYSCEHNHPWPLPSKTKSRTKPENTTQPETPEEEPEPEPEPEPELELEPNEEKPASVDHEDSLVTTDDFSWFGDMNSASSTILENPIFTSDFDSSYKPNNKSYINIVSDKSDMNFFPMREEDELLFADLGELPECSTVFNHHHGVGPQVQIC